MFLTPSIYLDKWQFLFYITITTTVNGIDSMMTLLRLHSIIPWRTKTTIRGLCIHYIFTQHTLIRLLSELNLLIVFFIVVERFVFILCCIIIINKIIIHWSTLIVILGVRFIIVLNILIIFIFFGIIIILNFWINIRILICKIALISYFLWNIKFTSFNAFLHILTTNPCKYTTCMIIEYHSMILVPRFTFIP